MTKKRWLIVAVSVVLLIAAGALAWWYFVWSNKITYPPAHGPEEVSITNEQLQREYDELKASPPADSDSKADKAEYYNQLADKAMSVFDCVAAEKAYRDMESIDQSRLQPNHLTQLIDCHGNSDTLGQIDKEALYTEVRRLIAQEDNQDLKAFYQDELDLSLVRWGQNDN